MKRLSKAAEQNILSAVNNVIDLVEKGSDPNSAIVKVASREQIPHGHVQLIVQAYNTGKTNFHRKHASSVLEAAEEFPLADTSLILKELYPSTVKTAAEELKESSIASEYTRPPHWVEEKYKFEKQSRFLDNPEVWKMVDKKPDPYPQESYLASKKAFHNQLAAQREQEEKRAQLQKAHTKLLSCTEDLVTYFQKIGSISFQDVRKTAELKYGKRVTPLFDHLLERRPSLSKQASTLTLQRAVGEPYTLIERALQAGESYRNLKESHTQACKEAQAARVVHLPRRVSHVLGEEVEGSGTYLLGSKEAAHHPFDHMKFSVLDPPEKQAFLFDSPITSFGKSMMSLGTFQDIASKTLPKDPSKHVEGYLSKLNDPAHEAELRNIQTEAMLNDLLANDEVISGYHPHEVLKLYNDISNMAPRVSGHPMAVRSLLRKHLAQGGQLDPYELDLISGLENKLKQRDEPNLGVLSMGRPSEQPARR